MGFYPLVQAVHSFSVAHDWFMSFLSLYCHILCVTVIHKQHHKMSSEKTLPAKHVMVHMALLFVETLSTLITDAMADNLMSCTEQTNGYYDYTNDF